MQYSQKILLLCHFAEKKIRSAAVDEVMEEATL
jgi:hypothetical protein